MVLKKSKADNRTLFIDASAECIKVTNNNKLTEENIRHIVDEFVSSGQMWTILPAAFPTRRSPRTNTICRSAPMCSREDTREVIDIVKLNAEIEQIVAREQVLRDEIAKIIAEIEVGQ